MHSHNTLVPFIVLAMLTGCDTGVNLETAAAPGAPVSAELSRTASGGYHVDRLLVSKALSNAGGGEDDDDIECEDGVTPDGAPCADDDDGEDGEEADEVEDATDTDDVECEDGLTPDGQVCVDDDDDDGEEADEVEDATDTDDVECEDGLTPDGQVCVDDDGEDGEEADEDGDGDIDDEDADEDGDGDIDDEDADEDGDGDIDDEDAQYASSTTGARVWVQGRPELVAERNVYQLFNLDVNPGTVAVPSGVVRFDGGYANGYLAAIQAIQAQGAPAIGGPSEGIVDDGSGTWTLTVMGQHLLVDRFTEIVPVSNPMNGDDEADEGDENDGIDCQQEGEHDGDNEGC